MGSPNAYYPLTYLYAGHLIAQGQGYSYCDINNKLFGNFFTFEVFNHPTQNNCFTYGTSLGLPVLLGIAEKLGGEFAISFVMPLLSVMSLVGVWVLGMQLVGKRVAWLWMLLLAIQPLWIGVATLPMSDIPAFGVAIWSMVCWIEVEKLGEKRDGRGGWTFMLLAGTGGMLLGSALWIRYAAFVWFGVVGCYMLWTFIRRKHLLRHLLKPLLLFWIAAISICAVIVITNLIRFDSVIPSTHSISLMRGGQVSLRNLITNDFGLSSLGISILVQLVLQPFGLIALWIVAHCFSNERLTQFVFSAWVCGTLGAGLARGGAWGVDIRYNLPAICALILAIAAVISSISFGRWRWQTTLGRMTFVAVVIGWSNPAQEIRAIQQRNQHASDAVQEIQGIASKTEPNSVFITGGVMAGGLVVYGHRSVLSPSFLPVGKEGQTLKNLLEANIQLYAMDDFRSSPFMGEFDSVSIHESPPVFKILRKQ